MWDATLRGLIMTSSTSWPHTISEGLIREIVERFYADVRKDPLLTPIFEASVADWAAHNQLMCDFWSSLMNGTGRYHGRPLEVHSRLGIISDQHFDRWLSLFTAVCEACCDGKELERFVAAALRMRVTMSKNLRTDHGRKL
jgi:hemoglobin